MKKTTLSIFALITTSAFLFSCGEDEPAVVSKDIKVSALFMGEDAACGQEYSGVSTGQAAAQLADARVFLSNIELRNSEGVFVPLDLDDTSAFQDVESGVVLLDYEDGSGACADSGTAELNDTISGDIANDDYDAIRFNVGVPFEFNHIDSAAAPAPLNAPGMFWVWQGGYKHVRVDVMPQEGVVPRWNAHVGSTGCASDAPTSAPAEPCAKPNLAQITVENFNGSLTLDLSALFDTTNVLTNTEESPPGCMSSPNEPNECEGVFDALGLSFDTGACQNDCEDQTLFSGDS